MNATVGAFLNMFTNEGSSPIFGFSLRKASVAPAMNSGLSTTRTSQDCLFIPLGALMPQFRMVCIVSLPTGCGLYLRTLLRDMMVSMTVSETDFSAAAFSSVLPHPGISMLQHSMAAEIVKIFECLIFQDFIL